MKTVHDWLDEYAASHRNAVNRRFHYACIPPIVFSVICALKAIPAGNAWVNPASVVMVLALLWYLRLSWRLALGLVLVFAVFYGGALVLQTATGPNFIWVTLAIFVVGWIGQFVGHAIEGARPSFFKDLQFLLVGPLWELAHVYRQLGLPVDGGRARYRTNGHA